MIINYYFCHSHVWWCHSWWDVHCRRSCRKNWLWSVSHPAVCHHGKHQRKKQAGLYFPVYTDQLFVYVTMCVCVCVRVHSCVHVRVHADRGGDGDHAVGCSFSWDSMWVASGRLAGRSRFHSESQFIDHVSNMWVMTDKSINQYWRRHVNVLTGVQPMSAVVQ